MSPSIELSTSKRNLVFISCLLQQFGYMILSFGHGAAMPQIVAEMGQAAYYAFVTVVWSLSQTIVCPIAATLSDRIGRKPVNVICVIGACVMLVASYFVTSFIPFVICWFFVGCFIGGQLSGPFLLIVDNFEMKDWGKKQGNVVMAMSVGMIVGPLAAGVAADAGWTRGILVLGVPFMLAASIIQLACLPSKKSDAPFGSFDSLGIVWLVLAVAPFVAILNFGGNMFPWASPITVALAAAMICGIVLLVRRELRIEQPVFALRTMKNRNVLLGCIFGALGVAYSVCTAGFLVYFAQAVLQTSATSGSTLLLPQVIVSMIAPMFVGPWLGKNPNNFKKAIVMMGICFAVTLFGISMMKPGSPMIILYALMAIGGIGFTLFSNAMSPFVTMTVDAAERGGAMGCYTCFNNLGSTIVGSVFGLMLGMFADFTVAITSVFAVGAVICILVSVIALLFVKKIPVEAQQ